MSTKYKGDILTEIARRDRAPKAKKIGHRTMYMVLRGAGGPYKGGKLFTKAQAEKIVKRAASMGIDMYVSGPIKTSVSKTQDSPKRRTKRKPKKGLFARFLAWGGL